MVKLKGKICIFITKWVKWQQPGKDIAIYLTSKITINDVWVLLRLLPCDPNDQLLINDRNNYHWERRQDKGQDMGQEIVMIVSKKNI